MGILTQSTRPSNSGSVSQPSVTPSYNLPAPTIQDPILDCGAIHVSNIVPNSIVNVYFDYGYGYGLQPAVGVIATTTTVSVPQPGQPSRIVAAAAYQQRGSLVSPLSNIASVRAGVVRGVPGSLRTLCALTRQHVDVPDGSEVLIGTDLGIPVTDANGDLFLLFGDAFPTGASPAGVVKPIFRARSSPPTDDADCALLSPLATPLQSACKSIASYEGEAAVWFESLLVDGLSLDASFEVPSGAFFFDGRVYAFVTKRSPWVTVPAQSVVRVPSDVMLASFLVSRAADCEPFQLEFAGRAIDTIIGESDVDGGEASGFALRFINIAAYVIDNQGQIPELPAGELLLMWGTGLYHQSKVYFAWTQVTKGEPIPEPTEWWFLTSLSPLTFEHVELPDNNQLLAPLDLPAVDVAGEISVTWIETLQRWCMFVGQSTSTFNTFYSALPWGPWTAVPTVEPGVDPVIGVGGVIDFPPLPAQHEIVIPSLPQEGVPFYGLGYGNYIIPGYIKTDVATDTITIYVVSSFNHPSRPPISGLGEWVPMFPDQFYGTFLVSTQVQCAEENPLFAEAENAPLLHTNITYRP
jgi:hypothetical protein